MFLSLLRFHEPYDSNITTVMCLVWDIDNVQKKEVVASFSTLKLFEILSLENSFEFLKNSLRILK